MTEETKTKESPPPEKLLIDDPSNFQFHAAYLTYSNIFDNTTNPETKKLLNQNITALQQNQMDYPAFYESIDQFRGRETQQRSYGRFGIKTERKKEWRRKAQRHERIERHKK